MIKKLVCAMLLVRFCSGMDSEIAPLESLRGLNFEHLQEPELNKIVCGLKPAQKRRLLKSFVRVTMQEKGINTQHLDALWDDADVGFHAGQYYMSIQTTEAAEKLVRDGSNRPLVSKKDRKGLKIIVTILAGAASAIMLYNLRVYVIKKQKAERLAKN